MQYKRHTAAIAAILFAVIAASDASAFSSGITTASFPNPVQGCNFCHSGGDVPLVSIFGPTSVAAGATAEYSVIITDTSITGDQDFGGLNVSAILGALSTGGVDPANTQLLSGEITHTAPKAQGAWDWVTFTFEWTAPLSFTSATLEVWGNAVDLNSSSGGDAAGFTTLEIFNDSVDTPTPTATVEPTPTPTPASCVSDFEPRHPYLIADAKARKCQQTIGKAGGTYLKKRMKAVQKCLADLHKGKIVGDPDTVCRGVNTAPTDAKAAAKLAKAEDKLRSLVEKQCTDDHLQLVDSCADNVSGLQDCLVEEHTQLVDALIEIQYGTLVPTTDKGEQKCQKAIANEGGKFATKALKLMQKCLDGRNKSCVTGDAAALCIGSVVGGGYVPPSDTKTAEKLGKLEGKLLSKIPLKCTAGQLGALDSCATTPANQADCLLCSHRQRAFDLVALQYGGADVFTNPSITLQAAINDAAAGDVIMLDPGDYFESVSIPVGKDNLHLLGQEGCGGERAELRQPGTASNGIFAAGVDGLIFERFNQHDFHGNNIFVTNAEGVTFRNLVSTGPGDLVDDSLETAYALFPVVSNNVLIEDCTVSGINDAGIYVGQSTNIIVRNNEVFDSVAGIEIENSANAEVYGNYTHDNAGGILVFKLPGPAIQFSDCHDIHDNIIDNNNGPNYGFGTVGLVPSGSGLVVLSNDSSVFRNNVVTNNKTFGFVAVDQPILQLLFNAFNATCNGGSNHGASCGLDSQCPGGGVCQGMSANSDVSNNFIVDNVITSNGFAPDSSVAFLGVAGDGAVVLGVPPSGPNCRSGNTTGTTESGWNGLPACTLPVVLPGCPIPALNP